MKESILMLVSFKKTNDNIDSTFLQKKDNLDLMSEYIKTGKRIFHVIRLFKVFYDETSYLKLQKEGYLSNPSIF